MKPGGQAPGATKDEFLFSSMPPLGKAREIYPPPPGDEECFALWDKYAMLDNIRRHSLVVARVATSLATRARARGIDLDVAAIRAAALLHDIAKTWCVAHGGGHAIIGASWTCMETRHHAMAQAVLLHVHWPWELPKGKEICSMPIFVLYADKRAMHDQCVSLDRRFEDLLARYGKTEKAICGIRASFAQAKEIETRISRILGENIGAETFGCESLFANGFPWEREVKGDEA